MTREKMAEMTERWSNIMGYRRDGSKWNRRVQRVFADFLAQFPFLKLSDTFVNIAEFGPKFAFSLMWESFVETITLENFRYKLKNGWDYFKVGYKTHDFDSAYALREFVWKLGRIRKCIGDNDMVADTKRICKQIQQVEELITRVVDDEVYMDEAFAPIDAKYGERNFWFGPEEVDSKGRRTSAARLTRPKETPRNRKHIQKLEVAAFIAADTKRRAEWSKAMRSIKKNIFTWWD